MTLDVLNMNEEESFTLNKTVGTTGNNHYRNKNVINICWASPVKNSDVVIPEHKYRHELINECGALGVLYESL
ncbi:MAG: hypothetical protein HRT37_25020 [Alteromonadaceae bacterium]|nr:hypothetical protein [Alteromonadaceae bacterium]